LNQKPINVIDYIKAVDGEVRVPTVWQAFLFVYHCPFTPYFATDVPI
jgi:hypothetical protein